MSAFSCIKSSAGRDKAGVPERHNARAATFPDVHARRTKKAEGKVSCLIAHMRRCKGWEVWGWITLQHQTRAVPLIISRLRKTSEYRSFSKSFRNPFQLLTRALDEWYDRPGALGVNAFQVMTFICDDELELTRRKEKQIKAKETEAVFGKRLT